MNHWPFCQGRSVEHLIKYTTNFFVHFNSTSYYENEHNPFPSIFYEEFINVGLSVFRKPVMTHFKPGNYAYIIKSYTEIIPDMHLVDGKRHLETVEGQGSPDNLTLIGRFQAHELERFMENSSIKISCVMTREPISGKVVHNTGRDTEKFLENSSKQSFTAFRVDEFSRNRSSS